ncbi:hypothetical protein GCM10027030_22290 [Luteococcus sediminum]|uniref:glycosyl hydrolase family 28-related protein n=1 Tax=Luteococcus sp. TaxID=1969402 RepID=UPI003735EF0E
MRHHGAVGDRAADDTPAIQRAIDAAGVGGTIFLPLGTYRTSAPLRGLAQQTFRGAGGTTAPGEAMCPAPSCGAPMRDPSWSWPSTAPCGSCG